MKMIMSTLLALGIAAGAAHAQFNTFNDPSLALPRSESSNHDDFNDPKLALPRSEFGNDDYRQALPFTQEIFPDIVVAIP